MLLPRKQRSCSLTLCCPTGGAGCRTLTMTGSGPGCIVSCPQPLMFNDHPWWLCTCSRCLGASWLEQLEPRCGAGAREWSWLYAISLGNCSRSVYLLFGGSTIKMCSSHVRRWLLDDVWVRQQLHPSAPAVHAAQLSRLTPLTAARSHILNVIYRSVC